MAPRDLYSGCFCAFACVGAQASTNTHTRSSRTLVRVPWLGFGIPVSDAYGRKSTVVTVKFYEIFENRDFSLKGLTQCIFPELTLSGCAYTPSVRNAVHERHPYPEVLLGLFRTI